jgi:hypothetical protein
MDWWKPEPGFLVVTVNEEVMNVSFIGLNAKVLHSVIIPKKTTTAI